VATLFWKFLRANRLCAGLSTWPRRQAASLRDWGNTMPWAVTGDEAVGPRGESARDQRPKAPATVPEGR
jgi:hypothetical protein